MNKKVKLELVGLDGNAYALMGAFQRAARQQGWTKDEIKVVMDECMSGNYNHLLATLVAYTESPDEESNEFTSSANGIGVNDNVTDEDDDDDDNL